nr:LysR family transcriptional regulator [uncultured Lichenicoccus sp.]
MDYYAGMRAFVRAVELGSFSKAAEEAGVKVSTVSRYVSRLEADLGAAILNRSTRSLHLTEAGQVFYERSVQILNDVEEARDAVRSLNARPQGLLRIALPAAFGRRHVMPHMRAFLDANPDLRLDAMLADTFVDLIETGIDVAVRIGVMADSNLIAKRLAPETFVLVGSPYYLSHHPEPQEPADLAGHECLVSNPHAGRAWHFREAAEPNNPSFEIEVGGRLRTSDLEVLRQAVTEGGGIALLPDWLCHCELQDGRMKAVLPQWTWYRRPGRFGRSGPCIRRRRSSPRRSRRSWRSSASCSAARPAGRATRCRPVGPPPCRPGSKPLVPMRLLPDASRISNAPKQPCFAADSLTGCGTGSYFLKHRHLVW